MSAMSLPRTWRTSASLIARTSLPSSSSTEPETSAVCGSRLISVRHVMLFPDPDSPTIASVEPCSTLAIVGESGSGKSITCLTLMSLLPHTAEVSGSVLLDDGRDVLAMSEAEVRHVRGKDIALIYQDPMAALNPVRTIGSQIREPLRIHMGMTRRAANTRAVELLAMVGIPSPERHLKSYPHEFSGGMLQRTVIAMALACNPKVLLADEPTTALDVSIQAQILELLKRLSEDLGIPRLLVSHN